MHAYITYIHAAYIYTYTWTYMPTQPLAQWTLMRRKWYVVYAAIDVIT